MGRPPCCDKNGVKKGAWTPEEDIVLVSYVQQHGPANWRLVPTNTGLKRCSKSCRLRWTNYLRPGIKRGDFTPEEEMMIIQLQALLGNRWAAMAAYLPERTDNDIKNYWNTHLKKKLNNHHPDNPDHPIPPENQTPAAAAVANSKGQWERHLQTDIHHAKKALRDALSLYNSSPPPPTASLFLLPRGQPPPPTAQTSAYASSTENIARLLPNWMKKSPNSSSHQQAVSPESSSQSTSFNNNNYANTATNVSSSCLALSSSSSPSEGGAISTNPVGFCDAVEITNMPLSLLEKWLLDDAAAQGQEGFFLDMAMGGDC